MAWFAVSSLMRTIELEFLQPNPRLVLHSTEAVEELHGMLSQFVAFLEESENQFNCDDDETMDDWKMRVKDGALRVEDEIESQVIDITNNTREHTISERLVKSFQRATGLDKWLLAQKFHKALQNAIESMGELTAFVKSKQPSMNDNIIIPSPRERIFERFDGVSNSSPIALHNTMVGHVDELDEMKNLLLQDSFKRRQVVPIVGMGGIGKTTFARRLFEDPLVSSHFDIAAWTTVSAHYGLRRTLLELLSSIMPITEEINLKSNEELAVQLRKCLMGRRRYLIVLDDVWSTNSWDEIQRCFPDNNDGSRILLTCRLHEVASYTSSHNDFPSMRFLTSDESWELFRQRVLNYGIRFPANLESTWRHIVDYCQGLPFAIVLIAGLVQTTDESLWESKDFERTLYALVSYDLAQGISKILGLSYSHLPNSLKACFLYFGVFPENSVIRVKDLIRLWIAEGFVRVESERSLEEVGEDFLKDLVSRSLVLINSISLDGKIKTCKVHDIVHDFCRGKAIKENLLFVRNRYNTGYSGSYRWTSIETMYPKFVVPDTFNKSRSLFCFYDDGYMTRGHQMFANNFKMLRVLNFSSPSIMKDIPLHFVDLVLLRYLVLRPFKSLRTLPVSKNWNLQTLVLLASKQNTSAEATSLISEIWELPKLRHVQVCKTFVLDSPTVVQQSLQTIYWLHSFQCTKQVFSRIPNAMVVGIFMEGSGEFGSHPNCLDNLRCLNKLEKLKIKSQNNPILLPSLDVFPIHLKKLIFKGTLLPWNAMTLVIGMLPNLQVLKLKDGACQGREWALTGAQFHRLKSLLICGTDLMHWTTTSDDFPVLERLILNGCYDLGAIPSSFEVVPTLQLIELYHCYSSLVNCAKQIQEEQRDYGNDVLVVRNYNTRGTVEEENKSKENEKDFEEQ